MGNCQTAEAAAVIIHHSPGGRVERAHGALSAAAVMVANPGHYVAAVVPADAAAPAPAKMQRRLKLLRPDDTLALGGVYRLVRFDEVLREFVSKRHAATLSRVVVATTADDAHRPESEADGSHAKQQEEDLRRAEETAKPKRSVGVVGRRAILHRRHRTEMDHLNSKHIWGEFAEYGKQGKHSFKALLPRPDQEATSGPPDPTMNDHHPSDSEPDFSSALMVLGGRFGLARHGQWRPALPSIAEGSIAC